MTEFNSHQSYRRFANSVRRSWRYSRNSECTAFLEAVLETSRSKQEIIPNATNLWRAQVGHDWSPENSGEGNSEEFPAPFEPDRMMPLTDRAREGRANPKGISYLYLATHDDTAAAEVRPWVGSHVSIGQFRLLRIYSVSGADAIGRNSTGAGPTTWPTPKPPYLGNNFSEVRG